MSILSLVLAFLISFVASVESDDTLLFTQVLFRHGARAPSLQLTNTSYGEQFHRGLGELTDRGFENSYKLGKFLKKRYVDTGFLNRNMIPREMYWRSVNKRRCLSTAATVGASMFEDHRHLQVAVFTDEFGEDLLSYDQKKCPREDELVKEKCPDFDGNYSPWPKYEGFIANCLNYSHPAFEKFPFHTIEAHMNEYKNGIPLPPLLAENIDSIMELYVNVTQFITGTGNHHNEDVMQMKFGYLVYTLLENIMEADMEEVEEKFVVYSTQDWILMGVLDSFGVLEESVGLKKYPEYNSMIIMEVWENVKNESYVKMFYKAEEETEEDHKLIDLTAHVRNCAGATECPLNDFVNCCSDYKYKRAGELCQKADPSKVFVPRSQSVVPNTLFGEIGNIKRRKRRFAGPE